MLMKETVTYDDPDMRLFGNTAVRIERDNSEFVENSEDDPRVASPLHYIMNIGRFLRLYESPQGGTRDLIKAVADAERESGRKFARGEAPIDEFSARDTNEKGLNYPNDRYLESDRINNDLDFEELVKAAQEAGFWIRPIYLDTRGPICNYNVGFCENSWENGHGYDGIVWISPKEMAECGMTPENAFDHARSALGALTDICNGEVYLVGEAPDEMDGSELVIADRWTWHGPFFGRKDAEEFVREEYGEQDAPSPC